LINYKHLNLEEREKIFVWKEQGVSFREIGRRLNRSHSSITRELGRNKTGKGKNPREYFLSEYIPCKADRRALKRGVKQRKKAPLKETLIWLYVREHLREPFLWSPEEISGRLKLDYPGKSIGVETIYRYIYSRQGKKYCLWKYLVNCRKKRMKKIGRRVQRDSKIPKAVSIDCRPKIVGKRTRLGDWETDNMHGRQTDSVVLSVSAERLTRLSILSLVNKSSRSKTRKLINRLKDFPKEARLTLTADNGAENTNHQSITRSLEMQVYFCHPYSSWERGTVENTNSRIRRYLPKGQSLNTLTNNQIKQLEYRLNSTPRKCLGYLTPYEKIQKVLSI